MTRFLAEFIVTAVLMTFCAFLAVEALEREEFPQQAKMAEHRMRNMPTWGNDGPETSTGHSYYLDRKEMNR